jgi:hypothetical protein
MRAMCKEEKPSQILPEFKFRNQKYQYITLINLSFFFLRFQCEDLSKFLNKFAANENQNIKCSTENSSAGFAKNAHDIWDLICKNKEIIAADHKV